MDVCPTDAQPVRSQANDNIYTMTPEELKNHFLQAAADRWKAQLNDGMDIRRPRFATSQWLNQGRVVCQITHGAEDAPETVVAQLRLLYRSDTSRFEDMKALLREDVREIEFEGGLFSLKPEEMEGVAGAAAMIAELAPMYAQMAVSETTTDPSPYVVPVRFKLVVVEPSGRLWTSHYSLPPDATLDQFLRETAQRYPTLCGQHDARASGIWRQLIAALRAGGVEPWTVDRIEGLVRTHEGADYERVGRWLCMKHGDFRTGSYLQTEENFREMMAWARTRSPRSGCLMRSSDSKIFEIYREIRAAEEAQLCHAHQGDNSGATQECLRDRVVDETAAVGEDSSDWETSEGSPEAHCQDCDNADKSPRASADAETEVKKEGTALDNDVAMPDVVMPEAPMMADTFWEEDVFGLCGKHHIDWEDETLFDNEYAEALRSFCEDS